MSRLLNIKNSSACSVKILFHLFMVLSRFLEWIFFFFWKQNAVFSSRLDNFRGFNVSGCTEACRIFTAFHRVLYLDLHDFTHVFNRVELLDFTVDLLAFFKAKFVPGARWIAILEWSAEISSSDVLHSTRAFNADVAPLECLNPCFVNRLVLSATKWFFGTRTRYFGVYCYFPPETGFSTSCNMRCTERSFV